MAAPLLLSLFVLCFNCGLLGCPIAPSSVPALPAQEVSQGAFLFFCSQQHFKFKNLTRVLVHLALNNLNAVFWKIILFSRSFSLWQGSYAGWTGCNAVNVVFVLLFTFKFFFAMMAKFLCHPPYPEAERYQLGFAYKKTWSNWEREPANESGFVYSNCRHVHSCFPTKGQKNAAFTAVRR